MASSLHENVLLELGFDEFYEANNVLLMSLMEETHEDEYNGDDRLVTMIQSLEAEINDPLLGQRYEVENMGGQDCYTSSINNHDHWIDMELVSSFSFDEINAFIPCGDEIMMEHVEMEYEGGNAIDDFKLYYEGFLEQQQREIHLSQGPSSAIFSN
ncbi:hypothetical protein Lal_00032983 [Lupinus albus]|uniref:Uncharacterized protein n=1 Tax=Lupinus albus TaxID=3870 RepID=A0A6A4R7B4_LUPAL|nr:hypothetical protein Lalb_Chr01g0016121 [Lupinus albus]KAF1898217.1 hypothetical protein Lal_00032983 [Lupinus albus]